MTTEEITEIKDAIALVHHLIDDDPLTGWKYDMCKAVLSILERVASDIADGYGLDQNVNDDGTFDDSDWQTREDFKIALPIARVINQKQRMTIL